MKASMNDNNSYAAYNLGKIYSSEDGYIDMNKAIEYFKIAAKDNNSFAEYQLGKIYLYGNGVNLDYDIECTISIYLRITAINMPNSCYTAFKSKRTLWLR